MPNGDPPSDLATADRQLATVLGSEDATGAISLDAPEVWSSLWQCLNTYAKVRLPDRDQPLAGDGPRIAALVNGHVGWTIALNADPRFAALDGWALRRVSFPFAQGSWTLERLANAVLDLTPAEPRIALWLNPGFADGPPPPQAPLEGFSLDFQLADQARTCGRAPGFWRLDAGRRELWLSGFSAYLRALPPDLGLRARRLLDIVPPPDAVRDAILAACNPSLSACTVKLGPPPTRGTGLRAQGSGEGKGTPAHPR